MACTEVGVLGDGRGTIAPPVVEITAGSTKRVWSDEAALECVLAFIRDNACGRKLEACDSHDEERLEERGEELHVELIENQ